MGRTKKLEVRRRHIRVVELVIPFVSSPPDMLARVTATLHHAVKMQQSVWNELRENIAVYGPKKKHMEGVLHLVYRIAQDSGDSNGARREVWSHKAEDFPL